MSNIVVPELGESVVEARVARWLKQEGERRNISIPVRFYFPRHVASGLFLTSPRDHVVLKLRSKHPFPFGIGFQDDKFYQSFAWNVAVTD